jgi:50S ribosomal subunit-associated GTPase HflX
LLIVNKIDKVNKLKIPATIPVEKICRISAKKQQLTELETKISGLFSSDLISNLPSYSVLSQS